MGRCCECINVCVCAPNKRPRDWDDEEEENEKKKKKEENDGVEHDGDGDDELEDDEWDPDWPCFILLLILRHVQCVFYSLLLQSLRLQSLLGWTELSL